MSVVYLVVERSTFLFQYNPILKLNFGAGARTYSSEGSRRRFPPGGVFLHPQMSAERDRKR
jgi:hypothetical protein